MLLTSSDSVRVKRMLNLLELGKVVGGVVIAVVAACDLRLAKVLPTAPLMIAQKIGLTNN